MKSWCLSPDADEETRKALQKLAREEMKSRFLADIAQDISVCRLEGWDYAEYLLELRSLIDSFLRKDKDKRQLFSANLS